MNPKTAHFKRFFRDKQGGNTDELGMDFQAAGIIIDIYPDGTPYKYAAVRYFHPYTGESEYRWRGKDDIEIYEYDDNSVQWYAWDDVYDLLIELSNKQSNQEE